MYNLTNYTILFISEIRNRLFYISLGLLCILLLCFYNINDLLIQLLYPIDNVQIEINNKSLSYFLHNSLIKNHLYDFINNKINLIENNNNVIFDHFPLFEINIDNNNTLYFKILLYFISLFTLPLLLYHIYLFIIPSLYYNEYIKLKKLLLIILLLIYFYLYYLNNVVIKFFLNITYNQFQEFYNYEFDIEFNLYNYINLYIYSFIFFIIHILYILYLVSYCNKKY